MRVLEVDPSDRSSEAIPYDIRPITGGILVQTPDVIEEDPRSWKVVTDRTPSELEWRDLAFAWKAAKHVKSNAIVFAKDNTLVGMGAGQPNRVVSVHLSQRIAGEKARGSVLASDAFFPFPDNIELAAQAGVTAIVQPGGSIRDQEVIEAANKHGLAMLFTGVRHFRH
jgi:phosphoribosylaminoimidazolecarboxamide formyltransferase/IMP cyclohydrolase